MIPAGSAKMYLEAEGKRSRHRVADCWTGGVPAIAQARGSATMARRWRGLAVQSTDLPMLHEVAPFRRPQRAPRTGGGTFAGEGRDTAVGGDDGALLRTSAARIVRSWVSWNVPSSVMAVKMVSSAILASRGWPGGDARRAGTRRGWRSLLRSPGCDRSGFGAEDAVFSVLGSTRDRDGQGDALRVSGGT